MSRSIHSAGLRVFLLSVCATLFVATAVNGADPKIVNASHEPGANPIVEETTEREDEGMSYSPQWPEPPDTGAMILRLCIGTVVVLGLCVGVLWFGKPWLQKLQVAGSGSSVFQLEGSIAVGNRAMLYLVKVGETQLIAGTDMSGLKSLIALPPSFKETLDEQVTEAPPAPMSSPIPSILRAAKRPESKE